MKKTRRSMLKSTAGSLLTVLYIMKKSFLAVLLALLMVEYGLAHTYVLRRNLYKLVFLDVLQALFE